MGNFLRLITVGIKQWINIFKVLREKLLNRFVYPVKLFFKTEDEMK